MKKILMIVVVVLLGCAVVKEWVIGYRLPDMDEIYSYCKGNGYSTDYCILVDFSKPTGINRFYIYDFNKKEIIHKSMCAQGFGKYYNVFGKKRYSRPTSRFCYTHLNKCENYR